MYCTQCGTENSEHARYCTNCGNALAGDQPSSLSTRQAIASSVPRIDRAHLASLGQRFGSWIVDAILGAIPLVSFAVVIANLIMFRRGNTVGLSLVGARIVRENGDLSGFFHT